jgi:hypothetical protein
MQKYFLGKSISEASMQKYFFGKSMQKYFLEKSMQKSTFTF